MTHPRPRFTRNLLLPTAARRVLLAAALLASGLAAVHAAPLETYLPTNVDYDPNVPTPDEALGYGIGTWHVRPDQVVDYMRRLAAASDRVTLEEQGRTHEDRLQILLTITSPEHHGRLDEIRTEHVALTDPSVPAPTDAQLESMPVVVWLGFSIHGNEPSGANAALLTAYHLAAARGPEIDEWLNRAVILLDPMYNPDGLGRFAHWANMHKGKVLVGDPNHREHTEGFPSGRTNHYWFDLNRDWLLLQHPESRNRVRNFHRWKPNLLTDHHEMGTNSTFFFQPGVRSRKNPLIPEGNLDLTYRLAEYHARALDAEGRLYYNEESFDDFYPGKGSTYPDLNGAVGILFEQASSRGHLQESVNGDLSFPFGIKNQFLTSLSSVRGAVADRMAFLQHQVRFYRESIAQADAWDVKAYVIGTDGDSGRMQYLVDNLVRHQVEVNRLGRDLEIDGRTYRAGEAIVVPLRQAQHVLVRSLFEELTEFTDKTFYDVSTWSLPLAFGAAFDRVARGQWDLDLLGDRIESAGVEAVDPAPSGAYAYGFRWTDYHAPRAVHRLLAAGYRARVATESFRIPVGSGNERRIQSFDRGTIVIPMGTQPPGVSADVFRTIAEEDGVEVVAFATGYAEQGIDLGSPSLRPLETPRIAVAVGSGVSAYDAGEIWHLLDVRFQMPVSLVEAERIARIDLDRYTHIILPGGFYGRLGERFTEALRDFTRGGGTLIGLEAGARWIDSAIRGRTGEAEDDVQPPERERNYASYRADRAEQLVSGTIVEANLDLTHPIAYGYPREELPVFRTDASLLPPVDNPYDVVATYSDPPRLSGYISPENQERLAGQPAVLASRLGGGSVIQILDNPNFRAIWYGPNRLLMNAIFFGPILQSTSAPDTFFE